MLMLHQTDITIIIMVITIISNGVGIQKRERDRAL